MGKDRIMGGGWYFFYCYRANIPRHHVFQGKQICYCGLPVPAIFIKAPKQPKKEVVKNRDKNTDNRDKRNMDKTKVTIKAYYEQLTNNNQEDHNMEMTIKAEKLYNIKEQRTKIKQELVMAIQEHEVKMAILQHARMKQMQDPDVLQLVQFNGIDGNAMHLEPQVPTPYCVLQVL